MYRLLFFPLLLLALCPIDINSQKLPKHTFFAQTGISLSNNSDAEGSGLLFGLGYQKQILLNRLRYVPFITFGKYTSKGITDVPTAYFNSTSLKNNINFDIINRNNFSLFIGTGFTINYTSGLKGPAVELPIEKSGGYFNQTNFTFNAALGFKFQSEEKLIGYEGHLFNVSIENKNLFSQVDIFQLRVLLNLYK